MKAAKFNTLDYANELIEAGFTQQQANIQAKALFTIVQEQTLTKQDLKELVFEMKQGFERIDQKFVALEQQAEQRFAIIDQKFERVDQKFEGVYQKFEHIELKIRESELRLLIRLTTILTVIMSALQAFFKFVPFAH